MFDEVAGVREGFVAGLTLEGFLTRVGPPVEYEVPGLSKPLVAGGTAKWFLSGVDPFVSDYVAVEPEFLFAGPTRVGEFGLLLCRRFKPSRFRFVLMQFLPSL